MKIALVNLITKTVDQPRHWWQLFGCTLEKPLETDEDVNIIRLAQAFAKEGHECHVFISDVYYPQKTIPQTNNLKVKYLKTVLQWLFAPAYFPLAKGLYKQLKEGKFDVIQASDLMQPATIISVLAAKKVFVWQEQDQYSSRWWLKLFQILYFHIFGRLLARNITFIPRSLAARAFLEKFGYKRISGVVPTAVDIKDTFYPMPSNEEYLLVVSRLAADKGLDFLLDAMSLVVKDLPNIKLLIKGDGPYRHKVEEKIKKLNLIGNVVIDHNIVTQKELNAFYNKALMVIIPTKGGLFPFVALESLAAGKPVITCFSRGLKDIVINHQTGFIVSTAQEMADKIIFLVNNEKERKKLSEYGLKLMKDYEFKCVADKFINTYHLE